MIENPIVETTSEIFDIIEVEAAPAEREALTLENLPQEVFQIFEIEEGKQL